jgi:general secretion pathway protein D
MIHRLAPQAQRHSAPVQAIPAGTKSKENALKTTFAILMGLILGLVPDRSPCLAHTSAITAATFTAMTASGQNTKGDPKRQVTSLLAGARKAISEADWDTAESLISQAEAQHVQFGKLHFGDTPEKCRKELERLRPATGKQGVAGKNRAGASSDIPPANQMAAPAKNGQAGTIRAPGERALRAPQPATNQQAAGRPAARDEQAFPPKSAGRSTANMPRNENPFDAVDRSSEQAVEEPAVVRLPEAAQAPAQRAIAAAPRSNPAERVMSPEPVTAEAPIMAPGGDARTQSDQLLVGARKALAVGDTARAAKMAAQAKALNVRYEMHEDNPTKIESAIQKQVEFAQLRTPKDSEAYRRRQVELLLSQAESLLMWKEFEDAERLANDASHLPIAYGPFDANPQDLLNRVTAARRRSGRFRDNAVAPAGFQTPASAPAPGENTVAADATNGATPDSTADTSAAPATGATRAVFDPETDTTRNVPASNTTGNELRMARPEKLVRTAPGRPIMATRTSAEMPDTTASDATTVDSLPPAAPLAEQVPQRLPPSPDAGSLLQKSMTDQQVLAKKVIADLVAQKSEAKRLQETDPKRSLQILQQARVMVEKSGLDQETRERLLRSADRSIADIEQYIEINRPKIELDERNQAVKDEIDREQTAKVEVQEKIAVEVEKFNNLLDEQRWAEAEVIAKRVQEMAPDDPIATQLGWKATFARRLATTKQVEGDKERGFVDAMTAADESSIPFDDRKPYQFADVREWDKLSKSPFRRKIEGRARRSEKEIEIEKSLRTPVSLKFQDAPLSEVMDHLKTLAGVNIHLDPRGLAAEGVTTEMPVNIDLSEPISLRSALNLILEPLHLSYVVKNEVLNITSEQLRDGEVYTVTYNVGDLVMPIPNFVPDNNMGMTGAINSAQANARAGMVGGVMAGDAPLAVASASGSNTSAMMDPRILAQMTGTSGPLAGISQSMGSGPGGLSGGAQPDFDSLIDLIVQTIQPESWDANGGPGSVTRFPNNLSLVISQKQDVHEEIADLLAQLRRLQDLQVTIEVRFITLNDSFFERIGVDFQLSLQDYSPASLVGAQNVGTLNQGSALASYDPQLFQKTSATVGTSAAGIGQYTDDLNVDLSQGSFAAAVPQFGSFSAGAGATLGFAILSDIEAFFFIEASQGDRRSNVLQAPKVTLFNGQLASVSDVSQSPFVISVIPVVGDFAAAQQPVIVVLSEGTMLTVQAVVSEDRRFVRLTLVPFFSSIGAVNTFTFTGSSSSTSNSQSNGPTDATTGRSSSSVTTTEGTTVQLPTFSFVSVSTTVSVPDGGTVLLGGVKRLSEGRNEFGVPILNKIPYVNRLFQNSAIGRQTESLMMMVTPRIIIQEEEEFNLTGQTPPPP